jgi:hypothetical protein
MTPQMMLRVFSTVVAAALLALIPVGCAHVKVDPIEVKTIHIQHDVTIGVDKALEDFFAFQERSATQPATTNLATTQPAAPATTQPAAAAVPAAVPAAAPAAGDAK